MEERYHVTTQNRFYPDMSNVKKKILQWRQNLSAHLRTEVLKQTACYSCQILMKLDFFPTDFRKIIKYQISLKKSVQWEMICSMQTGGQT